MKLLEEAASHGKVKVMLSHLMPGRPISFINLHGFMLRMSWLSELADKVSLKEQSEKELALPKYTFTNELKDLRAYRVFHS